jgi:hypothetical protein
MSYFSGLDFSDLVPDTYIEGICVFVKFTLKISLQIPEDPAYSTPDGSNFYFFSGRYYTGILCATVFLFFSYFGSILTQFRPGHRPQKSFF